MEPIITTAQRLGDVQEYYFSTKLREIARLRAEGHPVLNLGIGSPDLPPDPIVIDALNRHCRRDDIHGYQSYTGIPELRQAFADWYREWFLVDLDPQSEILPLIGSKEGIMHISMTYLEAGDEVLVPNPGYPAYRAVTNLTGATTRSYDLEERRRWQADLEALAATDLSRVKIMWLNYPNMPTGARADLGYFRDLVAFARAHQILLVNDNPYTFILNDPKHSLLSVEGAMDVALELNSLSKAHNMAGWRVGMLAGRAAYLQDILRFKSNMDSGMFYAAQMAAVEALRLAPEWYQRLNTVYYERRRSVYALLDLLDCRYDPDQVGMFVWAKVPDRYPNGYALADEVLYKAHVFITPGGIFGSQGDGYVRVALCSDGEIYREAIRRIEASGLLDAPVTVATDPEKAS